MTARLSRRAALVALSGSISAAAFGPAQADTPVLRLADQKGGLASLLRAAGELEGIPYRLEVAQFQAAAPLFEALNAGAVDIAWAGDAPTTFALANGTPAHIVSAHRSNGAGTALVVKAASPVATVADLPGRIIGTSRGSIGQALAFAALRANGLKAETVRFAYLFPADAKAALEGGSIDVWATWGVFVAQARLVDGDRVVVDGSHGLLSGLGYLNALDSAVADKSALLRDFIGRAARASRWSITHVDAYARAWAAALGLSFEVARLAFSTAPTVAVPIDEGVIADQQRTADLYTNAGLIARRIDSSAFFDASFNDALGA